MMVWLISFQACAAVSFVATVVANGWLADL
jgi:hypothetical protein